MSENKIVPNYGNKFFKLRNGLRIPAVGLGTYRVTSYDLLYKSIDIALDAGYRLFDTDAAQINEKDLRKIFRSLLPRHGLTGEDIFIIRKCTPFSRNGKLLANEFERALGHLGTEYTNIVIMHYPISPFPVKLHKRHAKLRQDAWLELVKLYNAGKINAIGVSNFTVEHLMQLSEVTSVLPTINQIEFHPYYYEPEMITYCTDNNIKIQAFNSFGGLFRGNFDLLLDPEVKYTATKHAATSAQILLLWALQKGAAVVPTSVEEYHIKNNKTLNFRLTRKEIEKLDNLGRKQKYCWDPTWIA